VTTDNFQISASKLKTTVLFLKYFSLNPTLLAVGVVNSVLFSMLVLTQKRSSTSHAKEHAVTDERICPRSLVLQISQLAMAFPAVWESEITKTRCAFLK